MKQGRVICVCGIDTDIGKTVATGLLARSLKKKQSDIISQKLVQTGCQGKSDDILKHRQIMGVDPFPEDLTGLTCPYVLTTPCSPHLAARLDNVEIDCQKITAATRTLCERYRLVLLEAAGGLFVPLHEDYTVIDYIKDNGYPVILVSNSRIGSINHTLASFEALQRRNIPLTALIYNRYPEDNGVIGDDSRRIIEQYLRSYDFDCPLIDMRPLDQYQTDCDLVDFADILLRR